MQKERNYYCISLYTRRFAGNQIALSRTCTYKQGIRMHVNTGVEKRGKRKPKPTKTHSGNPTLLSDEGSGNFQGEVHEPEMPSILQQTLASSADYRALFPSLKAFSFPQNEFAFQIFLTLRANFQL